MKKYVPRLEINLSDNEKDIKTIRIKTNERYLMKIFWNMRSSGAFPYGTKGPYLKQDETGFYYGFNFWDVPDLNYKGHVAFITASEKEPPHSIEFFCEFKEDPPSAVVPILREIAKEIDDVQKKSDFEKFLLTK